MSDQNPNRMQTPTPRDHNVASMSELMPFRSSKIKLWKSPLFMLAILAAVVTPLLFALMNMALAGETARDQMSALAAISTLAVFFLLMLMQTAFYLYVKPGRSILIYLLTFAIVVALFFTPVLQLFFFVFRKVLPGEIDLTQQHSFLVTFWKMLWGAGFMEELFKALPILLGAGLTIYALKQPQVRENPAFKLLHVRGPVDGILMGLFAGAGFIFIETAFDYIPRIANQALEQTQNPLAAIAAALTLMLPRVFGGIVGHMAYSGLFGYFIGLAVLRPADRWKLIGIGYVASTLIHTLWNSVPAINPTLQYAVAIVAAITVVGALLKARQIEASLGMASANAAETSGSILVERGATPAAPYPNAAPQAFTPPPQPIPQPAPIPQPTPAAPAPAAGAEQVLGLDIDGLVIPLRAGSRVDPAGEPALAGRGAGVIGEVVAHPSRPGVLGLRNAGAGLWTARLRDGGVQTIEANQNVRLAPGVVIAFSQDLVGAVRVLG